MTNQQILNQLVFEKDVLYNKLSSSSLSELFSKEYDSIVSGETTVLDDDGGDKVKDELEELRHDNSKDALFYDKVQLVKKINENDLIAKFIQSWIKVIDLILARQLNTSAQAAFFWYDAYDHPQGNSLALHGMKNYPEFLLPKYLDGAVYSDELIVISNVFDFEEAWPDCEAFEWTSTHIDAYFDLQRLFKLNSRVLLHNALAAMESEGSLSVVGTRPFYFYIAEHDMEVSMLYKL